MATAWNPIMARSDRLLGRLLLALLFLISAHPAPTQAPTREEVIAYRMKPGENLYSLAARYLMRRDDYRTVQRLNRIGDPLRIAVGATVSIPVRLLKSELLTARVIASRGTVRIMAGGSSVPASAGTEVPQGALLETGVDGFISVGLANGSQLSLPTRSRLRLNSMVRILLTNAVRFDVTIEGGKLDTSATPLPNGGSEFRLHTPRAVSAIRGTVLRVGFDPAAGVSATEVLDGLVAVQGDPAQTATMVPRGVGASISATGAVVSEPLLPAPELTDPGQVLVDPIPALRIKPIDGARAYHVQVAADAGFSDLVAEATADAPLVPLAALADGRWFVRVSAYSQRGLEGESQVYSVRRSLTGIAASASQDADRLRFSWTGDGQGRRLYRFQLVEGAAANPPMIDEPGLTSSQISFRGLGDGTYFWRVQVRQYVDGEVTENWTPFQKLTVAGMNP